MYDSALVFSFLEILLYQIAIVSKLNCNLFPVTNSVGTPNLIQEFIPLEERDQLRGPSGVSLGNWCKVTIGNPPILHSSYRGPAGVFEKYTDNPKTINFPTVFVSHNSGHNDV